MIALCTLYVGDEAQSLPGVMRCYDWNWGISFYSPLHSAFFNFHYRQKIQRSLSVTIGFSWGRGCRLPRNSLSKKGFSHLLSLIDEKGWCAGTASWTRNGRSVARLPTAICMQGNQRNSNRKLSFSSAFERELRSRRVPKQTSSFENAVERGLS